ncbi:MAG: rRNA pseudouridine synthase [Clostridia bacterium]|nr:rRNA pseudouridine synthase [Clostridia bacterium]
MEKIRLSKYFTDCGVMSRRAAEEEIRGGRVTVNGHIAELGEKIDPEVDEVIYKGRKVVASADEKICIMLNKPRGIVCTAADEKGRRNVTELCRDVKDTRGDRVRLYPVGRLDMDSDGLLLLTNDGELANKLTHPRHSVPKIYHVTLKGAFDAEALKVLGEPIDLDGRLTMRVKVRRVGGDANVTVAEFELFEGRNRQIRRMCEAHGVKIERLQRVAIGKLKLGALEIGKWRRLDKNEIEYLKAIP